MRPKGSVGAFKIFDILPYSMLKIGLSVKRAWDAEALFTGPFEAGMRIYTTEVPD
jgi:hypothetical protein